MWLSGVRRVGKTTLAKALEEVEFINCDLPSAQMRLEDPERFFRSLSKPYLVLDEVHQLADPSRVLKIAADSFPVSRCWPLGPPLSLLRASSATP